MATLALNQEELKAAFRYDAQTGALFHRPRSDVRPCWNARYAGKPAGYIGTKGYPTVAFRGGYYRIHRIVWAMEVGPIPDGMQVDHVDGDRTNNRLSNLRLATPHQNRCNQKMRSDNGIGLKGVRLHKSGRYCSRITSHGREIRLGYFNTPEDAHAAYVKAAQRYHGEFARAG
jgi:hypothetical protein